MPQENNFSYSQNGLTLTQKFEGLRLTAYQDQVGVWTIGYGHTGNDVYPELTITQEQADTLLMQDVASAVAAVNRLVTIALYQDCFDALVDFAFNLGNNALAGSTLLRKLNASDFAGAAAEFPKWCKAGGKVARGLLLRRQAEQQLFQQGMPQATTAVAPSAFGMAPTSSAASAAKKAPVKMAAKKAAAQKAPAKKAPPKKAAPRKVGAKKSPRKKKASRK